MSVNGQSLLVLLHFYARGAAVRVCAGLLRLISSVNFNNS